MVTDQKISRLVERLLEQTRDGRVRWEKTAERECFLSAFPDYTVLLRRRDKPPNWLEHNVGPARTVLEIAGADGEVIDNVGDDAVKQLRPLYELARRQALNADKAVDEILSALEAGSVSQSGAAEKKS